MKYFFITILAFIFLCSPTAFSKPPKNKHFDAIKLYADRDFVLNDTIEFSLFDMSELKFVNDSKSINAEVENQEKEQSISALEESKAVLEKLPSHFYRALKNSISTYRVPVTLHASESPAFAKPLQLYIKIKHIHLKPHQRQEDGTLKQPIELRVYGQIKDKKSGETLVKYYDSSSSKFLLASNQATKAYESMADNLMRNLAQYLRTKY